MIKEAAKITNKSTAKTLKNLRAKQNCTMRQVANKLGTAHSFISKTEQQQRRLDVGEFIAYCQILEQDPVTVLAEILAQ